MRTIPIKNTILFLVPSFVIHVRVILAGIDICRSGRKIGRHIRAPENTWTQGGGIKFRVNKIYCKIGCIVKATQRICKRYFEEISTYMNVFTLILDFNESQNSGMFLTILKECMRFTFLSAHGRSKGWALDLVMF